MASTTSQHSNAPAGAARGTGVAAEFPDEAVARDYETVNLWATPMTERFLRPGLRDLGRILEYMAPPAGREGDVDVR